MSKTQHCCATEKTKHPCLLKSHLQIFIKIDSFTIVHLMNPSMLFSLFIAHIIIKKRLLIYLDQVSLTTAEVAGRSLFESCIWAAMKNEIALYKASRIYEKNFLPKKKYSMMTCQIRGIRNLCPQN